MGSLWLIIRQTSMLSDGPSTAVVGAIRAFAESGGKPPHCITVVFGAFCAFSRQINTSYLLSTTYI
jgi:hypothetical protein